MKVLFIVSNLPSKDYPEPIFKLRKINSIRNSELTIDIFDIMARQSRWNYLKKIFSLRRSYNLFQPDIVHSMGGYANFFTFIHFFKNHVAEFLSEFEQEGSRKFKLKKLKYKQQQGVFPSIVFAISGILSYLIYWKAKAIIVKSRSMYNLVPKKYFHKTHIIPNGVDMNLFNPFDRMEARKKVGIGQSERVILFLGNSLNKSKNFSIAREAYKVLQSKGNIENLTLYSLDNVPPEEVPFWMNAADVGLLTSISEGSPNVIKEALSCNLPFVSSDVGDVRERTRKVSGNFIFENEDPIVIASFLETILLSEKRLNARQFIQYEIDDKTVSDKHLILYKKIVNIDY